MKLHFGHYIVIGMAIYMSYIIFLSTKMLSSDTQLVAPDYYEKSMQYDLKQQKVSNYKLLEKQPELSLLDNSISVAFSSTVKGKATMYRPSEKGQDKNFELKTDSENKFTLPKSEFSKGYWKLKLDWSDGQKEYYTEKDVIL